MESIAEILRLMNQIPEHGSEPLDLKAYEQAKVDSYNSTIGDLDKEDGFNCSRCRNKGLIAELHYSETYQAWSEAIVVCSCQRSRSAIRRLNNSGLKAIVHKYTFDNYNATTEWQRILKTTAQKFADTFSGTSGAWFFIGGQSGSGKTHLCTAIAVNAIKAGKSVKYMLWRDEIARLKAAVTDSDEYAERMNELKRPDVLYIDDLFKTGKTDGRTSTPTAADINAAFEIINYRYNLPNAITIISSERTLTELMDIDEAIAGRIAERSKPGGYCINLKRDPAKNYRFNGITEL